MSEDRGPTGSAAANGSARRPDCPLCAGDGGELVWRDDALRVVLPDEPDYPGFTRVIWNAHVAEMTDLAAHARDRLMRAVFAVESAQRAALEPDKVNLASLGNLVPHLHWHVIPRWRDDRHFPAPVWAASAGRDPAALVRATQVRATLSAYRAALIAALG